MYSKYDKVSLLQFYPKSGLFLTNNYTSEDFAKSQKDKYTIGMWKIKKLK